MKIYILFQRLVQVNVHTQGRPLVVAELPVGHVSMVPDDLADMLGSMSSFWASHKAKLPSSRSTAWPAAAAIFVLWDSFQVHDNFKTFVLSYLTTNCTRYVQIGHAKKSYRPFSCSFSSDMKSGTEAGGGMPGGIPPGIPR